MKIRTCHVSNSSSASFVCDICGETQSGWDASASEFDMCVCGYHVFCIEHVTKSLDEIKNKVLEYLNKYTEKDARVYSAAQSVISVLPDITNITELTTRLTRAWIDIDCIAEFMCPCCNMEKLSQKDILPYLIKKHGYTDDVIMTEFKSKFKNYKEFLKWQKK